MDFRNALNPCWIKLIRQKLADAIGLIVDVSWMASSFAYEPVANGTTSRGCMEMTAQSIATFNIGVPSDYSNKSGHSGSRSALNCKA